MRRYLFYLAVLILAFGFGSVVSINNSIPDVDDEVNQDPLTRHSNSINKIISRIESENRGAQELSKAENGELITLQGFIDEKFLCPDVNDLQTSVCSTVLLGNSSENKSVLIRLKVCGQGNKSNCIVWDPYNRLNKSHSLQNDVVIYDKNSNPLNLRKQNKFTGRASVLEGKTYFKDPIEKIESLNTN